LQLIIVVDYYVSVNTLIKKNSPSPIFHWAQAAPTGYRDRSPSVGIQQWALLITNSTRNRRRQLNIVYGCICIQVRCYFIQKIALILILL